jgi:hypothetical protein
MQLLVPSDAELLSPVPPSELLANDNFAAILAGPANRLTPVHVALESREVRRLPLFWDGTSIMKLQEHALPLPSETWESRRQPLPAGVRSIGGIMPEILNRYGLSLHDSDENQPQPSARVLVSIMPRTNSVLEPIAVGSS